MPRKTKDAKTSEKEKKVTKKPTKKASTTKKTVAKKKPTKKASTAKKAVAKKTTTKKPTTKKSTTKKTVAKKTTTKKATAKKSTVKKTTTTKKTAKKSTKKVTKPINEYYDLPYRYNQTIVKILAQTPKKLFVYWDISDKDRQNMQKQYGENFFENTKPILIINNKTLNYTFEVDINDFANSWYLDIEDADCEYNIELGRRPFSKENISSIPDYIYLSSSNDINSPNNKVLYDSLLNKKLLFRNVKTNEIIEKNISDFLFITNIGKFYNIYEIYKKFYTLEDLEYINNPSSGLPSSKLNSSQFK